jgi:deazaflavin-dependent oxidoreductase (nitroreductase family)
MAEEEFKNVLQDNDEVELTVTGRKTGNESSRPIWFVEEGDRVLLLPITGSDSNWYRNLVKTPEIGLAAAGEQLHTTAKPIDDPGSVEDVVQKFRDKYGADRVAEYYPKTDAAVEVPLG